MIPTMALLSEASRIRMFNKAMGTNLETLDHLPADYVAAVEAWAAELGRKGIL